MIQRDPFGSIIQTRSHRRPARNIDARHYGLEWGTIALIVGAAAAVAGTAVSVVSAVQSANRETQAAEIVTEQKTIEAEAIRESAAYDEQASRRRSQSLLARQRAIIAASGLDPSGGSFIDQEIDLIKEAELEALQIRRFGELSASAREYEAAIAQYRGQSAQATVPYTIAGGALQGLGTLTSAYNTYAKSKGKTVLSEMR